MLTKMVLEDRYGGILQCQYDTKGMDPQEWVEKQCLKWMQEDETSQGHYTVLEVNGKPYFPRSTVDELMDKAIYESFVKSTEPVREALDWAKTTPFDPFKGFEVNTLTDPQPAQEVHPLQRFK